MITVTSPSRIFWTTEEKLAIIDAAIALYQREEHQDLSLRQLLKQAMLAALPEDRHRDLRGVNESGMEWFVTGLKRAMREGGRAERRAPRPEPAPAPVEEEVPAHRRGPKTPPEERIRWNAEEKAALVAAAVAMARQDPEFVELHPREMLRRVMPRVLPPERHRDISMILTTTLGWLVGGIHRVLEAEPEPETDPEYERDMGDQGAEPEPVEVDLSGTGFTVPAILAPAPEPTPAAGSRDQVLGLLAGMNNTDLIGLLLSRLLAERQTDVSALTALMDEVRGMGERLNALAGQLGALAGRIAPLEAKATNSNRLLRGVLESLDPDLLKSMEGAPEPAPVPVRPPAPAPIAPPAPAPVPVGPPKPKICVLGVRPEQVARIAERVNGHATVIGVWSDQAMKHDFGQYAHVVTTPCVGGLGVKRVHDQVGKQNWTPVNERGVERIAAGVADVADRLEDQWRRAHAN